MSFRKKIAENGNILAKPSLQKVVLRLYVTGQTPRSVRAVDNIRRFCGRFLKDRFDLEVVDIYQQPALAQEVQIVAAPTLIKTMPLPVRRLVGDFSDQERVIAGLNLKATQA